MQGGFLFRSDTSNRKRQSIQSYLDDFIADNYLYRYSHLKKHIIIIQTLNH